MANVAKLSSASISMLDDQKTVMHVSPLDSDGNPTSLPSGGQIAYSVDNSAIVTLDTASDPSTLSVGVIGVKKAAGLPAAAVVTATFTNADGTTATGTGTFNLTTDPAELDVTSLDVTIDPATAQ